MEKLFYLARCFHRINRNIVECKGGCLHLYSFLQQVLIETLWNVKEITHGGKVRYILVLIETLWNVKTGATIDMASPNGY